MFALFVCGAGRGGEEKGLRTGDPRVGAEGKKGYSDMYAFVAARCLHMPTRAYGPVSGVLIFCAISPRQPKNNFHPASGFVI